MARTFKAVSVHYVHLATLTQHLLEHRSHAMHVTAQAAFAQQHLSQLLTFL
jgi:hypothetical protein